MIDVGAKAPPFQLGDHLGRRFYLSAHHGKRHVLMLFYPLDFTPT